MEENVELSSLLSRVLDMHDSMVTQLHFDLEKMARDYADLHNELKQLKANTQQQQYSLSMITVAYNLLRESPDKKIMVIKTVRDRFGLSLKDSKDLVDAVSPHYIHEG